MVVGVMGWMVRLTASYFTLFTVASLFMFTVYVCVCLYLSLSVCVVVAMSSLPHHTRHKKPSCPEWIAMIASE